MLWICRTRCGDHRFKATINEHFTTFDPADVDEYVLHTTAIKALEEGRATMEVQAADGLSL